MTLITLIALILNDRIVGALPAHQTLLFSATWPEAVQRIAEGVLRRAVAGCLLLRLPGPL